MILRVVMLLTFAFSLFGFQQAVASDKVMVDPHIYPAKLVKVVDGDTMDVTLNMGLGVLMNVRLRVHDYDAPETWRPSTSAEEAHGEEATAYAKELLAQPFQVVSYGWAVYNRVEAQLLLPDGSYFAEKMIEAGYEKRDDY